MGSVQSTIDEETSAPLLFSFWPLYRRYVRYVTVLSTGMHLLYPDVFKAVLLGGYQKRLRDGVP